jgi:hypothetical protein
LSVPSAPVIKEVPVVYLVVFLTHIHHDLCEEVSQEVIVWSLLEPKLPHVIEVDIEFL